jgi:hypothetical protein
MWPKIRQHIKPQAFHLLNPGMQGWNTINGDPEKGQHCARQKGQIKNLSGTH